MEGLSIICAGIGIIEEDDDGNHIGYTKEEHCLDNLKDLLRFLRRDDPESRDVFKQVCKWNIVAKDLIPIIEFCQDDRNLVLNAVKVLVFLTMPVEPKSTEISQQIEYLWAIKYSVTYSDSIPVIMSLLETPLENLESESFTEDDWKLVQLVLTLFRNILAIQQIPMQQKAGGSATHFLSIRDKFLERLFTENVMEVILVLTQHIGGSNSYLRQDNLLLLEIFHYIFMGQDPELVAKVYPKNSEVRENPETSVNTLKIIMEEEQRKRKLSMLRNRGLNSQFSGTFTRLTLDGSTTVFKGNPCSASHDALLKTHKKYRGAGKKTAHDYEKLPTTNNKILTSLRDFVNQLLSGGYNVLMESIREDIRREHHSIQNSDVVIFFQVACFVVSFQYHKILTLKASGKSDAEALENNDNGGTVFKGSMCGPISESLNESMFQLVISKWRYGFDGLKETNDYSLLSSSGSLLKIMIRMLDLVLKRSGEDSMEPKTARVLLYKLIYDQTEEGMTYFLLNMIKSFDKHKQAKSYLADLVECIHVLIRLMENLQERGTLRVAKKSRKKKVKNTKSDGKEGGNSVDPEQSIEKSVLETETETVHVSEINKDPLGTKDLESQWVETEKLDSERVETENLDSERVETENLESERVETEDLESERLETDNKKFYNEDTYQGTDDSSENEEPVTTNEVDLKISSLVSSLANNSMIKNVCWLLHFYKTNSLTTNHHIICILRRICDDLDLSPMLYQLSLLTTFYSILNEQKLKPCKEYENIVEFLTSLVRRMLRKMKKSPLLFVEVLFWKTRQECRYINCESMLHELNDFKKGNGENRENLVSENGHRYVRRSIADALGDDEADFGMSYQDVQMNKDSSEANGEETEFLNDGIEEEENLEKGENSLEPKSKGVKKRRNSLVIDEEMEEKIKGLFEKHKDDQECCKLISESLEKDVIVSPIQILKVIKKLGLKLPRKGKTKLKGGDDNNLSNPENIDENASLTKHLHTRKRVRALFSEDQEEKIKSLFEQFKDEKKCNSLIANALDAEGKFSTAQISRKLKQLGLHISKKKKSDNKLHLRDEEVLSDNSTNSDDEPLISRKRRSNGKTKENLSEGDSDEEPISSLLVKTKKPSMKAKKKKFTVNPDANTMSNEDIAHEDMETKRDEEEDNTGNAESGPSESAEPLEHEIVQGDDLDLDDELVEFNEDSSTPVVNKPRRRVVMDLDDDE